MEYNKLLTKLIAPAALLFHLGNAQAIVVLDPVTFSQQGNGFVAASAGSIGFLSVDKQYTGFGPLEVTGSYDAGGGGGEFFSAESVFNTSGVTWNDFHIDFDFEEASLFRVVGASLLTGVGTVSFTDTGIDIVGMSVAGDGGFFDLTYTAQVISDNINAFTITQTPSVVPEPTSLALLGLGLAGFGMQRRKKR